MRKIKFRAWDKENKEMFTGFSFKDIYSGHDESYIYDENDKWWSQPNWDNAVLMQYTGSKDEKGKEIYEGDIVNFIWNNGFGNLFHKRGIVQYNPPTFDFLAGKEVWRWITSNVEVNVIGNIYENPKLLKEINKCLNI